VKFLMFWVPTFSEVKLTPVTYTFVLLTALTESARACEPTLEDGVVAPQNQFNVESSWEKRTELKSLHTDVISS
jgi:hypothetical protein